MSAKKMRVVLIALAALLAASISGYVLVDHQKHQEEQAVLDEQASLNLGGFDANNVDEVEITNSDGYFRIGKQEGGWVLSETDYPHEFPLNTYYINVITSSMSNLTASQKVEPDAAQTSAYGLDDPVTVTCHVGNTSYSLEIGGGSITKEFYYVRIPGEETIYCIAYETGELLRGGIGYLRDSYMLQFSETAVSEFQLERDGEIAYALKKDSAGQWQLTDPVQEVSVNTVQINTILTNLVRVEYKSFETVTTDQTQLAEYGLDAPRYILTVKTNSGSTAVLEFPDFDENDGICYVYEPESGTVGSISMSSCGFLLGKWQELLDEAVLRVPLNSVDSLDCTVDGKHFTLTVDHENETYRLDDIDLSGCSDTVLSNFRYLYASVSEIKSDSVDENPNAPENPVPTCSFVYNLTDGTTRTLDLVPIDDTTYWAYVDRRCIGQIVRRNSLSGTSGVLNFIDKMSDALADEGIDYAPADAESPAETDAQASEETASTETLPPPPAL